MPQISSWIERFFNSSESNNKEESIAVTPKKDADGPVSPSPSPLNQPCNFDRKICPDGTELGREKYNCTFGECPSATQSGVLAKRYYYNDTLGVGFTYPADKVEVIDQSSANRIVIRSLDTLDFGGEPVELVTLQKNFFVSTYDDQNIPESVLKDDHYIQGAYYDSLEYSLGEGSRCGGGSLQTNLTVLREDLFVSKIKESSSKNTHPECEGDEFEVIETTAQDLAVADQIIGSIYFDEPAQILFSDEELGISFTYPANWQVATSSAAVGKILTVGDIIRIHPYQKEELEDGMAPEAKPQTEFPPMQLADGSSYSFLKQELVYEGVKNSDGYYDVTDRSFYSLDIPGKIRLFLAIETEESVNAKTEEVVSRRYYLSGNEVSRVVFDKRVEKMYALLQTLELE